LRGDEVGYFEPGAGFLRPEACIQAQLDLARRAGAQVFVDETVSAIGQSQGGAVEIITNRRTYSAASVIVTVGPWIQRLLGSEYAHLFRVYRQTMSWFALVNNRDLYTPERFPIFIWITGNRSRDMMYGFPAIDGPDGGIKIGTEQYEATVEADAVPRNVADSEIAALHREYVAPHFPDISNQCLRTSTCLYTVTRGAKFIIDKFRELENVWFASACSGHGFKHSAAIGEALARQALQQPAVVDLAGFKMPGDRD
jgi:sarcosine oxidase